MSESTSDIDFGMPRTASAFLPIVLLGVSIALVFIFQISLLLPQRTALQQSLVQNENPVQQSKQLQAAVQRLVMDVYNAAPDDKDAQAIIANLAKQGIQVNPAAAPAASPAAK